MISWSDRTKSWVTTAYVIIAIIFLYAIREALAPLIVAGLIAYLLNPVVNHLNDHTKLSHNASVAIVFWLLFGILVALPSIFLPQLFTELETLSGDLEEIYFIAEDFLDQPLVIAGARIDLSSLLPNIDDVPDVGEITTSALHFIEAVSVNFLWFLVILAVIYYLLKDWSKLREWLIGLAPTEYQSDVRRLHEMIKDVWRGYLRGNLVLMFIVGVVFSIVWAIIGVPAALALGVITGLFTIVPDVGPATAAVIAILVAWIEGSTYLQMSNSWFAVLVLTIYVILINIKNIWLRPRLFGRSVHMHEGVVFVSIILAVILQGILGAIIVIPTLASLGIIGRYFLDRLYDKDPFEEATETDELAAAGE